MSGGRRNLAYGRYCFGLLSVASAVFLLSLFITFCFTSPAEALPSFARQTGQPCGACHTDYAGLTPYGRRFKIGGYTYGGGAYRTTLFPSSDDAASDEKKKWVPPISMMALIEYTHSQTDLPPPTAPYSANNNVLLSTVSFFWGGAISDHLGAFSQVTYNPPGPGGFGTDPFAAHTWHWDNTDVRYANSANIGRFNVTYGVTANNSPTVQDPWNTTPAWSFPYAFSFFSPGFGSTPILDGAFAQQVAGVGAYAFVNDLMYLETTVYHSLDPNTLNSLGTDPFDTGVGRFDFAPYWRLAFEPHWGRNSLEIGTFGMTANINPWVNAGTADTSVFSQTDKFTDIGVDTQYQYQGDNYWLTLRGSWIHEYQKLDASFFNTLSGNPANELNEARAYASFAYGNDNRVILTGQYFNSWGNPDLILYAANANFSPNTNGWIAEIAYIPFISSQAPGWPWFNARIGLQYTWYTEFNGTSLGASANNSLYLYLWMAM